MRPLSLSLLALALCLAPLPALSACLGEPCPAAIQPVSLVDEPVAMTGTLQASPESTSIQGETAATVLIAEPTKLTAAVAALTQLRDNLNTVLENPEPVDSDSLDIPDTAQLHQVLREDMEGRIEDRMRERKAIAQEDTPYPAASPSPAGWHSASFAFRH